MEKEKEENIRRRKKYFLQRRNPEKKKGEGKGGKCLEKKTEASIMEKKKFLRTCRRVQGSTRGPCGPKKFL